MAIEQEFWLGFFKEVIDWSMVYLYHIWRIESHNKWGRCSRMAKNNTIPTYKRQRFLLEFIRQIGDDITSTDLQKLVFLYTMREKSDHYQFIPYRYGAYSFQLTEDIGILRRDGYLLTEGSRIRATGDYQHKTSFSIDNERGDRLIRKAYRQYPYYAMNSEIISRLFNDTEAEHFERIKRCYAQTSQIMYTIGYEGKSIETFMNILIQNDVRLLCDVRKNPLSRKFGFSKGKLKHIAETIGIKYTHIPDLGIESGKRKSLDTAEEYQCLFKEYSKTLPNLKPHLDYLYTLLCSNDRVALMCYEAEPEMCHRHVIRDYLSSTYELRSVDL
jgi:uncharacterized protein (DUF488 family)